MSYTLIYTLFQVQKGKPGTKGQKQIVKENEATLQFYRYMALIASVVYIVAVYIFHDIFTFKQMVRKLIKFTLVS